MLSQKESWSFALSHLVASSLCQQTAPPFYLRPVTSSRHRFGEWKPVAFIIAFLSYYVRYSNRRLVPVRNCCPHLDARIEFGQRQTPCVFQYSCFNEDFIWSINEKSIMPPRVRAWLSQILDVQRLIPRKWASFHDKGKNGLQSAT